MQTIWRDFTISITPDDVLRGQGADPQIVRGRGSRLIQAAEWAVEEGLPLIQPVVLVHEAPVLELRHNRIVLEGGRLDSPALPGLLGGAERLALMAATLGPDLESVSAELFAAEPLLAMALEGFGVAAVEQLSTLAANRQEALAQAEGLVTSTPLSPGMEGWSVASGQPQLFALLNPAQIGVRYNESWMIPRFSVTQILGIGKEIAAQGRVCDYCSLQSVCRYSHAP